MLFFGRIFLNLGQETDFLTQALLRADAGARFLKSLELGSLGLPEVNYFYLNGRSTRESYPYSLSYVRIVLIETIKSLPM